MSTKSIEAIEEIEKRARLRDLEVEEQQNIDLGVVSQIEKQAEEQGYLLIKRNNKNRANFTQVIFENIDIIVKNGYLTMNELGFLMSIQPLLEFQINAIMDKETNAFMNISEIADYISKTRVQTSRIISALLDKGILFEFVNAKELKEFGRNVTSRTLFLNPELFYSGDRNKIDGTLSTLVFEYDSIEKNGIKLDWKVLRKKGESFGRLYRRNTYLKEVGNKNVTP